MAGWRDHKARMLQGVHRTFEAVRVHLTNYEGSPVRDTVRDHRKPTVDKLTFADFSDAAAAFAAEDILVFDLAQIAKPSTNSHFIVSRSEAYRLDALKPAQDGYVYASVTEMTPKQISDLLELHGPEGAEWEGVI